MKTATSGTSKQPYEILEQKWAKFVGSKYAVSCNSGTSALHLSLLALGIGPGDEVIIPDFTMAAVAFAVSYTGAKPVFCEIEADTYGIDWKYCYPLINDNTKAIIFAHTYGHIGRDFDQIIAMAKDRKIPVIEDACEAQGAVYKSKANFTCYSFFRNKIIAAEEGGMVTTNAPLAAAKMRYLKNMAFSPEHDYYHRDIGYNYRMANAQANLALESLKKYRFNKARRRHIERWYKEFLPNWYVTKKHDAVWFMDVTVGEVRDRILKILPSSRAAFKPLSTFPMYGNILGSPIATKISNDVVLLPANPELTKAQIKQICKKITNV